MVYVRFRLLVEKNHLTTLYRVVKQVNVVNGDRVKAGYALTAGSPVLHDILKIMGPEVLQHYLVDQIQEIYRRQGVNINDRHIELIVRQMLRKGSYS